MVHCTRLLERHRTAVVVANLVCVVGVRGRWGGEARVRSESGGGGRGGGGGCARTMIGAHKRHVLRTNRRIGVAERYGIHIETCCTKNISHPGTRPSCITDGAGDPVWRPKSGLAILEKVVVLAAVSVALDHSCHLVARESCLQVLERE
jgi:hypothetical protein